MTHVRSAIESLAMQLVSRAARLLEALGALDWRWGMILLRVMSMPSV